MRAPAFASLGALSRRTRRAADRLGYAGLIGVAILATCVGYYAGSVLPLQERLETLHAVDETAAAPMVRPAAPDEGERLQRFAANFPDEREVARVLGQLYALGESEGVRLAQGEYRFVKPDALGMVQYQMALPVTGTYPRIRGFIGAVLRSVPWIAVTQVTLRRERIGEGQVEARIGLTLHLRAGGANMAQDTRSPARFSAAEETTR